MDWTVTIGRRKTSVSRVFIRPAAKSGKGEITVNKRPVEEYFPTELLRLKIFRAFVLLEKSPEDYDIKINVRGGGINGQAEAVRMGFARALVEMDAEARPVLKTEALLTRDDRMVERKKYGLHKARKAHQFSKR